MDIVQTDITLTKIPSCKSSGFGTWQLSGVLLWFAPAGWWGIGQRQVCLPKDWLSSSSAPWKQKTKELAGTPFGHKVWRQRGSKGWGEEKKNTDTAFCFASNYGFIPLSHVGDAESISCLRCYFRSDQWLDSGAETRWLVDGRKWKDKGVTRYIATACVCIIIFRRRQWGGTWTWMQNLIDWMWVGAALPGSRLPKMSSPAWRICCRCIVRQGARKRRMETQLCGGSSNPNKIQNSEI